MQPFKCSCCGEILSSIPHAWHFDAPAYWLSLPPIEREKRGELLSDQCVIDEKDFFIRGTVEIPVLGSDENFAWGVWVSLSEVNFLRASSLWQDSSRVNAPAYLVGFRIRFLDIRRQ